MQEDQMQPQSQFVMPQAVPGAAGAASSNLTPLNTQQYTPDPQSLTQQSDPLSQATQATEACIARTVSNPNARMQEIAKIRAAYIKAKFGMDITQ